jgi:two-component sensor histidine kinase
VKTSNWYFWPLIAACVAVLFTGWDITLMTRAHRVQDKLHADMAFLDRLGDVGAELDGLLATHRSDLKAGKSDWPAQVQELHVSVDRIFAPGANGLDLAPLQQALTTDLNDLDSLHWEVVRTDQGVEKARMDEAVLALVGQRARGHLEKGMREVRQGRIGGETFQLSGHWQEAQWLLLLAILFAVVSAALVGSNSRLLRKSHVRTEQLASASSELERINRELRETMLSKEEKEVMLKEIHHRVKNNLQIVRSLIRFQTDKVDDPRVQELFNECVNRVGAMALVHEQTYLSKDLANIDVGNYLNSLVRDLASAYNIRVNLHMDVDIKVKTLGVDTLTPLGLLINEVISNSFKHAFTGRESGTIIVHLSGSEEGGLDLRVGDDGVGIPDHGRWEKPKSLGMELIHTLAGQLNATIELQPGAGMVYALRSVPYPVRKSA